MTKQQPAKFGKDAISYWAKKETKTKVIGVAIATVLFVAFLYWFNAQT